MRAIFWFVVALPGAAFAAAYAVCANQLPDCAPSGQATLGACSHTCRLVAKTLEDPVGAFTALLCWVVWLQFLWLARQEGVLQRSVRAATDNAVAARISADAAVRSAMPVVFPEVRHVNGFHPVESSGHAETFTAKFLIGLDNSGATPAIVREFRAALVLMIGDLVPNVDHSNFPRHELRAIYLPSKTVQTSGFVDFTQEETLSPYILEELLVAADTGKFRRYALIGQVIYDDFFDQRHTAAFCLKLRWFVDGTINEQGEPVHKFFSSPHGGRKHNWVASGPIPIPDPLDRD